MKTLRDDADQQRGRAEEAEKLTRLHRYDAEILAAQRAWENHDVKQMVTVLDSQRPEHTGGEDLRGFEWYYLWRLVHQELVSIQAHASLVESVRFSPDGRRLVTSTPTQPGPGSAKLWDAWTGRELCTLEGGPSSPHGFSFTPDGRRLACCTDSKLTIWDSHTGRRVLSFAAPVGWGAAITFSPDGRRVAMIGASLTDRCAKRLTYFVES
jgi:WD40 repeat protein